MFLFLNNDQIKQDNDVIKASGEDQNFKGV